MGTPAVIEHDDDEADVADTRICRLVPDLDKGVKMENRNTTRVQQDYNRITTRVYQDNNWST